MQKKCIFVFTFYKIVSVMLNRLLLREYRHWNAIRKFKISLVLILLGLFACLAIQMYIFSFLL